MTAAPARMNTAVPAPPRTRAGDRGGTWLFVLPWALSHPGGVNQVVENLYDANRRVLGAESLLLVTSWHDRRQRVDTLGGRRTIHYRLREPWEQGHGVRSLVGFAFWLPRAIRSLARLLSAESVEIVNVHYPSLTALPWTLVPDVLRGRVRLALSFHGMDVAEACRARGLERWLWRRLLAAASSITVCNTRLRDELGRVHAAAPAKTVVVDNGVDPSKLRQAAGGPMPAMPQDFLLSLGTFEHKKGHDVAIDAFARLAARYPAMHLVIAGRTDPDATLDSLRSQARQLGCLDRVLLLPNLDHATAMALLARARALVLASRDEPFGIVVLEAGVFRRPVIATAVCGAAGRLPEAALLRVPADDPEALSQAIARLIDDPELAQQLGAALGAAVADHFDWDEVVKAYRAAMRPAAEAARPALP